MANPGFSVAAVLMPTITLSPKALTGQRSLGTLMQDIPAFAPTTAAVARFALSHRDLFQLSAGTRAIFSSYSASLALFHGNAIGCLIHASTLTKPDPFSLTRMDP